MHKPILNIRLSRFLFFYNYVGYRVVILLCLSIVVALLDGFGLALFIPMLQLAKGSSAFTAGGLDKLNFIFTFFSKIGIGYNLQNVMIIILILFIAKGVINFIHQYYTVYLQTILLKRLRVDAIDGLGMFKYTNFTSSNVGRIQNTLSEEIHRISEAFYSYFFCMSTALMISAYLIFSFSINFQFSLFIIIGSLLANLCFRSLHKKTKTFSVDFTKSAHNFQSLLMQQVIHFKYLKASNLMSLYIQKIKQRILITEEITKGMAKYGALLSSIREPISVLIILVILYFQLTIFQQPFSTLLLSLLLFYRSITLIMQLQNIWFKYLQMHGSIENYKKFMGELNDGKEEQNKIKFQHLTGNIELKKVYFDYGQQHIIKGIDLLITKNETIALVGKSGSGKTTLVNLIIGLMPVNLGEILIDNINIGDIDLKTYRNRIGYITQDAVIFNDTLYNNITCWADKTEFNLAKFKKVISEACLNNFGYKEDIALGSSGINVSGGEKQRIAIARELFKDIDILIIDEGTSSLDTETEILIKQSIDNLKGKLTIFIIAHRLSTIKNADRVIVIKNGMIDAEGAYEVLKQSSPDFIRMVLLQEL